MLKQTAGDTLRHARWAKGLSIRALAEKAEVSHTSIVKLENGDRNVAGLTVYAIAQTLDIAEPSVLFEVEEQSA